MYAYDSIYIDCAQATMAGMFQFAVYEIGMKLEDFFRLFIASPWSRAFERGNPKAVAGHSGAEIAMDIVKWWEQPGAESPYTGHDERSPEYWTGHVLAYYQWMTGLRFEQINRFAPVTKVKEMYFPYHEMDVRQFVDHMEELRKASGVSQLKQYRQSMGYSQAQLARITDIPVKTIQNLEQGQKDINKLRVDYCVRLARALGCEVEMLVDRF